MQPFNLTPRQGEALDFIRRYIATHKGAAPSFDEIAAALGCKSKSNIHRLLIGLEERGAIRRLGRLQRSITIVEASNAVTLPSHVHARLARYCADRDERFDAVLADAVVLHLDELERIHRESAA